MTNKTKQIEELLLSGGTITSMDAFKDYGATRLSDVVYRLKKKGLLINAETEVGRDRFGNIVRYTRYSLIGE